MIKKILIIFLIKIKRIGMEKNFKMTPSSAFDLLVLPELVLNKVLQEYLDLRCLKSLRLTCTHTKFLIENNPEVMKRFRLVIHRMKRFKELQNSKIPWNNIFIDIKDVKRSSFKLFSDKSEKLAKRFNNRLKIVDIKTNKLGDNKLLKPFLAHCANTLEAVCGLKSVFLEFYEESIKNVDFPELKFLEAEVSIGMGTKFGHFLVKCPNLRHLNIHTTLLKKDNFDEDIAQPLKDYLKHRLQHKFLDNNLKINFSENPDNPQPVSISPEELTEIVGLCTKLNTKLENVSISSLPSYGDAMKIQNNLGVNTCLDLTVTSITSYTAVFKDQYIPQRSRITAIIDLECNQDFTDFEIPEEVNAISLLTNCHRDLIFDPEYEYNIFSEIFHLRPFLKEFSFISRNSDDHYYLSRRAGMPFNYFPNLTKLHLHSWSGDGNLWSLFEAFPLLETLNVSSRSRLTDMSILGPELVVDNRSLLGFKYLKHVSLKGFWSISDISFRKIFSKMKLLTFEVWIDPDVNVKNCWVTLAGVEALQKGVFGETVEFMKINRPCKSTHQEVKNILKKCKCLKRFELREKIDSNEEVNGMLFSVHHL